MDRALDSLSAPFRSRVFELLARLTERGFAIMIVQTSRTQAEHDANVAAGTSKTSHSKHIPRRLRGIIFDPMDPDVDKADAIDLCPYDMYQLHGADKLMWGADLAWQVIGEEAEKLDLRWGGRWVTPKDPGHCELVMSSSDRKLATEERLR